MQLCNLTPSLSDLMFHFCEKLGLEIDKNDLFLWYALESAEIPPLLASPCPRFLPLEIHSFGFVSCGGRENLV